MGCECSTNCTCACIACSIHQYHIAPPIHDHMNIAEPQPGLTLDLGEGKLK